MERAAWTDERLDDLAESMRSGFARLDEDVRSLRAEMRDGDAAIRAEMRAGFAELRSEIESLRLVMLRIGGGMLIALLGVIAAILARGA